MVVESFAVTLNEFITYWILITIHNIEVLKSLCHQFLGSNAGGMERILLQTLVYKKTCQRRGSMPSCNPLPKVGCLSHLLQNPEGRPCMEFMAMLNTWILCMEFMRTTQCWAEYAVHKLPLEIIHVIRMYSLWNKKGHDHRPQPFNIICEILPQTFCAMPPWIFH